MAIARVQVSIPYTTGFPEDVAQNVFHVQTGAPNLTQAEAALIASRFVEFYNGTEGAGPPNLHAIAYYLSPVLDRNTGSSRIKVYDLSDPEPRVPTADVTWTLGGSVSSPISLPEEVALVLSVHGDLTVSGQNNANKRGRTYIGPLNQAARIAASGVTRPDQDFIGNVGRAAVELQDDLQGDTFDWVVYSPTSGLTYEIVGGWIDNAFDTQRRRGPRSTLRTNFAI